MGVAFSKTESTIVYDILYISRYSASTYTGLELKKSGTDEHGRKQIGLEYESASYHMPAESNSSSSFLKIFQISVDFQDF